VPCATFPLSRGSRAWPLASVTFAFQAEAQVFSLALNSLPLRRAQMSGKSDPISGWSAAVYFHKPEVLEHLEPGWWDSSVALVRAQ
jgi:hypothetical protein